MPTEINISNSVVNIFTHEDCNTLQRILQAKKENENDLEFYADRKRQTKDVSKALYDYLLDVKKAPIKAKRAIECGHYLQLKQYPDLGYKSVAKLNLCRERLCLNCAFVKAREDSRAMIKATKGMNQRFLTLTVPNVKACELRTTMSTMRKALKRMFRALKIPDYYEKYEITVNFGNSENNLQNVKEITEFSDLVTYHPHIHILLPIQYFTYKQATANRLWAKYYNEAAGRKHSYLITNNEIVRDNIKSALELSKYITKPTNITADTIPVFDEQIKGIHLHQAHGIYKELLKKAKADLKVDRAELKDILNKYDYELLDYIFNGENYIEINRTRKEEDNNG